MFHRRFIQAFALLTISVGFSCSDKAKLAYFFVRSVNWLLKPALEIEIFKDQALYQGWFDQALLQSLQKKFKKTVFVFFRVICKQTADFLHQTSAENKYSKPVQ